MIVTRMIFKTIKNVKLFQVYIFKSRILTNKHLIELKENMKWMSYVLLLTSLTCSSRNQLLKKIFFSDFFIDIFHYAPMYIPSYRRVANKIVFEFPNKNSRIFFYLHIFYLLWTNPINFKSYSILSNSFN